MQEHGAAVNTDTSPNVQYDYDETVDAAGELTAGLRPSSVTYPNGRVLRYEYTSGDDDNLARISYLADDSGGAVGTHLAEYTRLGLDQVVKVDYTEPDLRFDLAHGAGAGLFAGLDKFGRVVDLRWNDNVPNPVVRINHTYDRMSNRLCREDVVASDNNKNLDEFYTYDGVNQLKTFQRGNLNASPPTGVTDKNFAQRWCFDATGNWVDFDQDDDGDNTWDLQQTRTHNTANEITALTAGWSTPAHDRAGNMTTIPQPNSPSESYTLTFDAWNRLVRVEDGEHLLAEYEYDGLHRRTLKRVWPTPGEGPSGADSSSSSSSSSGGDTYETTHFYYSNQWQVLEERVDDSTDAERQYIWGLRYIDDLILRDRDTESGGDLGFTGSALDERLYALQDANWNVGALTDTSGNVVERYVYDPYGNVTIYNADWSSTRSTSNYANTTLYTGRELDAETGLILKQANGSS